MKSTTKGVIAATGAAAIIGTALMFTFTGSDLPERTSATPVATESTVATDSVQPSTVPLSALSRDTSTPLDAAGTTSDDAAATAVRARLSAMSREFVSQSLAAGSGTASTVSFGSSLRLRSRFSTTPNMDIWTLDRAAGKWQTIKPSAVSLNETVTVVCQGGGRWVTRQIRITNVRLSDLVVTCTTDGREQTARVFKADGVTVYQLHTWTPLEWTTDPESVAIP